ncbi:MAG: flavodoxin [Chloroflexota bacterium]
MSDTTKTAIFYGSTTGTTEMIAEKIQEYWGKTYDEALPIVDVKDKSELTELLAFERLFVGCPTWDIGYLQDDWADVYPHLDELDLSGKQIALFGPGDQAGYPENFQDALGILGNKFMECGATLVGYTSTKGYEHTESVGVDGERFMGLAIDEINQSELTDSRIKAWVAQVKQEFDPDYTPFSVPEESSRDFSLKLIGAGFPRTGTMSLQAALNQLGVGPCHHMVEVLKDKEQAPLWQAIVDGREVDFDLIYENYQSTVDAPGCFYYKELLEKYPDAKVLLSVRDPERWYSSVMESIYLTYLVPRWMQWMPTVGPYLKLAWTMVWDKVFEGRVEDKAHAIAIFNAHNEEVKRVVPPEKLLVFNVKDGWEPLCEFLDVPMPQGVPFPHLNDKESIRKGLNSLRMVGYAVPMIALGVTALIAWLLGTKMKRKSG